MIFDFVRNYLFFSFWNVNYLFLTFSEVDPQRRAVDAIRLSDYFNRPVIIERGTNLDHFVRGLATQPQHAPDRFFTAEVLF